MLAKSEQASLMQPPMEENMKVLLAGAASLFICGSAMAQTPIPAIATYRNDVPSSGSLDPNAIVGASCASSARVAALNAANPGSEYSKFQCANDLPGDVEVYQQFRIYDVAQAAADTVRKDLRVFRDLQDRSLSQGLALAGALDIQGPAEGRSNRFGMSSATYDGTLAMGFSYSRRSNDLDIGAGMSFTEDKVMGKVSAGWSW